MAEDPLALQELFALPEPPDTFSRYNIAPTQEIGTVHCSEDGSRRWSMMRWGLVPSWMRDLSSGPCLFNARSETVAEKPSFRGAYARRRCLVPATAWYEWQQLPGGSKQPCCVRMEDGAPVVFAGLWEEWKEPGGASSLLSVTILTTVPTTYLSELHDRMPVLVSPEKYDLWLVPARGGINDILHAPEADALCVHPVTPRIGRVAFNSPACLEPIIVEEEGLFG